MTTTQPPVGSAGYWEDVDDEFTVADWKHQVADDNTRMGYHAWALANRAMGSGDDIAPLPTWSET